jgi:hypothetical protein
MSFIGFFLCVLCVLCGSLVFGDRSPAKLTLSSLKISVMHPGAVLGHFKTGQLPPFSAYFAEFEFHPILNES